MCIKLFSIIDLHHDARSEKQKYVLNRQAVSDRYARTGILSLTWKPGQVKNGVCVCV
jgi:hypothetical protein